MSREVALIAASNAAVLLVALVTAFAFVGAESALLCAAAGMPMTLAVALSELRLHRKAEISRERDSVLFALQQIHSSARHCGKPLLASIDDALAALDSRAAAGVCSLLSGIRRRLLLGAQLDEATLAACHGEGPASDALRGVGGEYANGREPVLAVKGAYDRLCRAMRLEDAANCGKLQKYLTASMALGTVLPSFVMFAFTGYSMIYYSSALLTLFCTAMMVIMPNIFALARAHTAGLYEV
jgi:hypothetical protein